MKKTKQEFKELKKIFCSNHTQFFSKHKSITCLKTHKEDTMKLITVARVAVGYSTSYADVDILLHLMGCYKKNVKRLKPGLHIPTHEKQLPVI